MAKIILTQEVSGLKGHQTRMERIIMNLSFAVSDSAKEEPYPVTADAFPQELHASPYDGNAAASPC